MAGAEPLLMLGALSGVEMSRKCTRLWREATFGSQNSKTRALLEGQLHTQVSIFEGSLAELLEDYVVYLKKDLSHNFVDLEL